MNEGNNFFFLGKRKLFQKNIILKKKKVLESISYLIRSE
jgi:hypothetical protein